MASSTKTSQTKKFLHSSGS